MTTSLMTKARLLPLVILLAATIAPGIAQAAKLTVKKAGTVTSSPAGINCGATCSFNFTNSSVTLTAAASAGSTFTGWSGACTGTVTTCTVTMNAAKTATATFTTIPV